MANEEHIQEDVPIHEYVWQLG